MKLRRIDEYRVEIPREGKMRVPGRIYADDVLLEKIRLDKSVEQVANVATLPGIVEASLAMPDIHWGYGFPIGGVAAFDPEEGGVISPGGVGFDINCGVRLLRTDLKENDVRKRIEDLVAQLFATVPVGVGVGGATRLGREELERVATRGAAWAVENGFGEDADLEATEAGGRLPGADPAAVGERPYERGRSQVGSVGSGNHFVEVQVVDRVEDPEAACALGLEEGLLCVMIHTGSRGFGYQICDDTLKKMSRAMSRHGIEVPDKQLACVPIRSPDGEEYAAAMAAAANYAWANRQVLTDLVRQAFREVFGQATVRVVYDHAHNIAKFETHRVETHRVETHRIGGRDRILCVHRKGATRAFPPGHPEVPARYRKIGQPVLIPGDMGTASWVLVGAEGAMKETFGTCCHGAGRVMSRRAAVKAAKGRSISQELAARGVVAMGRSKRGLAEEAPHAYKDVDAVVRVVAGAGLARPVARMRPVGVIKG